MDEVTKRLWEMNMSIVNSDKTTPEQKRRAEEEMEKLSEGYDPDFDPAFNVNKWDKERTEINSVKEFYNGIKE